MQSSQGSLDCNEGGKVPVVKRGQCFATSKSLLDDKRSQ